MELIRNAKTGGGKNKKEPDIQTAKLRAATKIVNQKKLLSSLFEDANQKAEASSRSISPLDAQAWADGHKEHLDKAQELFKKGVSEQRLLTEAEAGHACFNARHLNCH